MNDQFFNDIKQSIDGFAIIAQCKKIKAIDFYLGYLSKLLDSLGNNAIIKKDILEGIQVILDRKKLNFRK